MEIKNNAIIMVFEFNFFIHAYKHNNIWNEK